MKRPRRPSGLPIAWQWFSFSSSLYPFWDHSVSRIDMSILPPPSMSSSEISTIWFSNIQSSFEDGSTGRLGSMGLTGLLGLTRPFGLLKTIEIQTNQNVMECTQVYLIEPVCTRTFHNAIQYHTISRCIAHCCKWDWTENRTFQVKTKLQSSEKFRYNLPKNSVTIFRKPDIVFLWRMDTELE